MYRYFVETSEAAHCIKDFDRIEARLTDLGIKGNTIKLSPLVELKKTIAEGIHTGAHTLVAIGNDITLSRLVSVLKPFPRITIGIIPLGKGPFPICRALGIPKGIAACDIIAARRLMSLDAGVVNTHELFLSSAGIPTFPCTLRCNHSWSLTDPTARYACVQNLLSNTKTSVQDCPFDGAFKVWVQSRTSVLPWTRQGEKISFCHAKTVEVFPRSESAAVILDGYRPVRLPVTLEILPQHLSCIVGKTRITPRPELLKTYELLGNPEHLSLVLFRSFS